MGFNGLFCDGYFNPYSMKHYQLSTFALHRRSERRILDLHIPRLCNDTLRCTEQQNI